MAASSSATAVQSAEQSEQRRHRRRPLLEQPHLLIPTSMTHLILIVTVIAQCSLPLLYKLLYYLFVQKNSGRITETRSAPGFAPRYGAI